MGTSIVRGTTPTVTLTNSDAELDLRLMGEPCVSIMQSNRELFFTDITVTEHTLSFSMSQEQTLSLEAGTGERPKTARIQCHFVKNNKRTESLIVCIPVYDTLHDGVIA